MNAKDGYSREIISRADPDLVLIASASESSYSPRIIDIQGVPPVSSDDFSLTIFERVHLK